MSELPEVRLESWPPGHVPEGPPYNLDVKVGDEWFALAVMGTTHFGGHHSEERRVLYAHAVEQVTRLLLAAPKLLVALEAAANALASAKRQLKTKIARAATGNAEYEARE